MRPEKLFSIKLRSEIRQEWERGGGPRAPLAPPLARSLQIAIKLILTLHMLLIFSQPLARAHRNVPCNKKTKKRQRVRFCVQF